MEDTEFEVEGNSEINLNKLRLNDRFNGKIHFEVVGKDGKGIKIKILVTNIYNQEKRVY